MGWIIKDCWLARVRNIQRVDLSSFWQFIKAPRANIRHLRQDLYCFAASNFQAPISKRMNAFRMAIGDRTGLRLANVRQPSVEGAVGGSPPPQQQLPAVQTPTSPQTPKKDQRFEMVRKLGSGTYGKVMLAYDHKMGEEVRLLSCACLMKYWLGYYSPNNSAQVIERYRINCLVLFSLNSIF